MNWAPVRYFVAAAMLSTLAGCGIGSLWGDDEPEAAEVAATVPDNSLAQVPVQAVRSVELGRTRDGFLISAYGTAPGLGYSVPSLRARRSGAPGSDGYIEYDFVANEPAPEFNLPPGTTTTRALRADLSVAMAQLQGASGIRVLSLNGGIQMDF